MWRLTDESALRALFRSRVRIASDGQVRVVGIPNAGKRGMKALNLARREGAAWGFPDDLILWSPARTALIEWKRPGGKPDDRQKDWHETLRHMGFPVLVATDPEQAMEWLRGLGAPIAARAM